MNDALDEVRKWLRRYGLALCCVVAPILLAYGAFNYAVDRIVPQSTKNLSFVYESFQPKTIAAPTQQQGAAATDSAKATKAPTVAPDPNIYLLAMSVAGRYNYAVASGFIYLVSAGAILFGIGVVATRDSWRIFCVAGVLLGGLALVIGSCHGTPYDFARPILIDRLLDQADGFDALVPLGTKQTGEAVAKLVGFNTVVALLAVAMILISLLVLSVRPDAADLEKPDLQSRLTAIRWALLFGSALLVVGVLASKALLQWPLSLVSDSQSAALQPIADALTLELGATGTFALFAAYSPAVAAWMLDVACLRTRDAPASPVPAPNSGGQSPDNGDGLEFASLAMVSSVLGVLAPILASPFTDALKAILGALSH
jgi:hypothetical protein